MKRLLAGALAVLAVVAVVIATAGTGGGRPDGYRVRAIFDNAAFATVGEDVKIAGVKVGRIAALEVTPQHKAALELAIDRPGFDGWRSDAHCTIRPQSLIGEKFVECTPTRAHAAGTPLPAPLRTIPDGRPGAGQHLLDVRRTSSPVDPDLINNTLRLPQRQRLTLIINELGAGLAANGPELAKVIHRADPALEQFDRVLAVLASENATIEDLIVRSDQVVKPLAAERASVASFVTRAGAVAEATAERRGDLERDLYRLPRFLAELAPTARRLTVFSDRAVPVLNRLRGVAPRLDGLVNRVGPFSRAGTPALVALGDAARRGIPAVRRLRPVIAATRSATAQALPLFKDLVPLTESFRDTGGIERFMDYVFFQVVAINGFDSVSHYLRTEPILSDCSPYAVTLVKGCSGNFYDRKEQGGVSAVEAARTSRDPGLERLARALTSGGPAPARPEAPAVSKATEGLLGFLLDGGG